MWKFDWNLPAYPSGTWAFNPFAWQLLFVFGGWCALGGAQRLAHWVHSPFVRTLAIGYLLFCFYIAMSWYIPRLANTVPRIVCRLHLSDRQDQPRRVAHRAFPGAGRHHRLGRAEGLGSG